MNLTVASLLDQWISMTFCYASLLVKDFKHFVETALMKKSFNLNHKNKWPRNAYFKSPYSMYGKGHNTVADETHIDDKNITAGKKTQTQQEEERRTNFQLSTTISVKMLKLRQLRRHSLCFFMQCLIYSKCETLCILKKETWHHYGDLI